MALALSRAELAEEGRVGEAVQPPPACHGEPEEVSDVAHAGQDLEENVVRECRDDVVVGASAASSPCLPVATQEQNCLKK